MLRLKGQGKNGVLIGLVLNRQNIEELTAGKPIMVEGLSVGVPGIEIVIDFAETDQEAVDKYAQFIGADTVVHQDPRMDVTFPEPDKGT